MSILPTPRIQYSSADQIPHSNLPTSTQDIKRKLTLVDAIHTLVNLTYDGNSPDGEKLAYGTRGKPQFKDSRHILTTEERIHTEGAELFYKFNSSAETLVKELRHFHNASGELGSSTRILSLVVILRKQLRPFIFLFQENAAVLFRHKVSHAGKKKHKPDRPEKKTRKIDRPGWKDSPNLENLPELLQEFADDLREFQGCLDEFREVVDSAITTAIESFEADLKYWVSCLKDHEPQLKEYDPAIRRYIHEIMGEMGNHLEYLSTKLSMFIHTSIPTIRYTQHHRTSYIGNVSTIATFFSAVTATTLQISLGQQNPTSLGETVNAFWFCSLIFSIAAAINSLLGLMWNQATYRSPAHLMPWWVLIWVQDSPVVFLVFSVACFSAGLVLLPYSLSQNHVTSTIVTLLTAFTSFGFVVVSIWMALERWVSTRHEGKKWLADVLQEANTRIRAKATAAMNKTSTGGILPTANASGRKSPHGPIDMPHLNPLSPTMREMSPARSRFIRLVRKWIVRNISPERRVELMNQYQEHRTGSRAPLLKSTLRNLIPTNVSYHHEALVRHLQFSPDGQFLATSSWDRTAVILRVGSPFVTHATLLHPRGFVGQVAWSPSGKTLLTKLKRCIKVWRTKDGSCENTIFRKCDVESIVWFPNDEAFMSIEGNNAFKLDLMGKVLGQYNFGKLKLYDVAITPTGNRLLGVGALLSSSSNLCPVKSKGEKQLIVYDMTYKEFESKTPVLSEVRDITIAQNGLDALVSYENKKLERQAPPQLWRIETVRTDNTSFAKLTLHHTFMPNINASVDFAGPSYFGGKDDELVLCASKAGDLHIWDRVSAVLLRHIRAQDVGGDLTCVAWNSAAEDPVMFATGSQIGEVRIWSSQNIGGVEPGIKTPS